MLTAPDVLKVIQTSTYQRWFGYEAADFTSTFKSKLENSGFSNITANARISMSKGVFIDLDGDEIEGTIQFVMTDAGPIARVFPKRNGADYIEHDLSDLEPPLLLDLACPDLLNLSWISKKDFNNMIQSAHVDSLGKNKPRIKIETV